MNVSLDSLLMEEVRRFDTGAVRSNDADDTPYHLITPIGLDEVAKSYKEFNIGDDSSRSQIGCALCAIYEFLSGNGTKWLGVAGASVMEAIAIEAGEDRRWVDDHVDSYPDDAYPECIPAAGLEAVARAYGEGRRKYPPYNWEKGMPADVTLDHGIRHLVKWLGGDRFDDHLGHAAWNMLTAIHSLKQWPHLNEGKFRGPGCTPPAPPDEPAEDAAPDLGDDDELFTIADMEQLDRLLSGLDDDPEPEPIHSYPETSARGASHAPQQGPATRAARPVLYISGPMSGIDDFNFPKFKSAARALREKGYPVLDPSDFGEGKPGTTWADHLRRALFVMGHADVLVQLPGWEYSRGACLEYSTGISLGLDVMSYSDLIALP